MHSASPSFHTDIIVYYLMYDCVLFDVALFCHAKSNILNSVRLGCYILTLLCFHNYENFAIFRVGKFHAIPKGLS